MHTNTLITAALALTVVSLGALSYFSHRSTGRCLALVTTQNGALATANEALRNGNASLQRANQAMAAANETMTMQSDTIKKLTAALRERR